MTELSADAIADVFGFPSPIGRLESVGQRGFKEAWRLDTGAGCMLVKRFWPNDDLPWRDGLERSMEFEQLAVRAGIDAPAPIVPARPLFSTVARIDGHGLFRAFPYLQHRPLADDDDIAEWIGTTLARMQQLRPLATRPDPNWWYGQHPPVPPAKWSSWLETGERTGMSWAPALRTHFEFVLEQSGRVLETFNSSPPYVLSHLDIEPWNVLMTADRPVLIDWDATGPDSAPLLTANVIVAFALRGREEPDPESIRRAYSAYVATGGGPLIAREGLLDRVIGRHLATITTALGGYFEGGHSEEQIRDRIEQLPDTVEKARAWERLLESI